MANKLFAEAMKQKLGSVEQMRKEMNDNAMKCLVITYNRTKLEQITKDLTTEILDLVCNEMREPMSPTCEMSITNAVRAHASRLTSDMFDFTIAGVFDKYEKILKEIIEEWENKDTVEIGDGKEIEKEENDALPTVPASNDGVPTIRFFSATGDYGELSNFFYLNKPIEFNGKTYATSEHLYHARKFMYEGANEASRAFAETIRTAATPYKAKLLTKLKNTSNHRYLWQKELAEKATKAFNEGARADPQWEEFQHCEKVMYDVLLLKFTTDSHCADVLLNTGRAKLIEDSKTDAYWGLGPHSDGMNKLGELLERVRDELRRRSWKKVIEVVEASVASSSSSSHKRPRSPTTTKEEKDD